jgi:hypothetical protein
MPICLASLPILPGSAAGAAALKYIFYGIRCEIVPCKNTQYSFQAVQKGWKTSRPMFSILLAKLQYFTNHMASSQDSSPSPVPIILSSHEANCFETLIKPKVGHQ